MITEVNSLCSDKQALGTSAVTGTSSTNVLDFVAQEPVYDGTLHFLVIIGTPVAGGTSVQAKIQTSANNSDWTDIADTGTVALASIPADGVLLDKVVDEDFRGKRYWRVAYTTVGSFTSGKSPVMTAGLFTEAAPHYKKSFA